MSRTIINLWKENNVKQVNFIFDCGGDNMGDTSIEIYDENDNLVENSEIEDYFDDKVYTHVQFYVNSDGHYQGENGVVEITLSEDFDEEDEDKDDSNSFVYFKNARSEYSESYSDTLCVELTPEENNYISKYVKNINGGSDMGDETNFNYKCDFIMTDELEAIENTIAVKVRKLYDDYEPDGDGELEDWGSYNTDDDEGESELKIENGFLYVTVNRSMRIYRDSND